MPALASGPVMLPAPKIENDASLTLNNYARQRLLKGEAVNLNDYSRVLAAANGGDEKAVKEGLGKVLPRLTQVGSLPLTLLPQLCELRRVTAASDLKLLRLVNYLIQVLVGDGSAGTPVPFNAAAATTPPVKAVDQFEPDSMAIAWQQSTEEMASHYQRQAALRVLAAATRASRTSAPDDADMLMRLTKAVAILLDGAEAAQRKKVPFFAAKKNREQDRQATLLRVATQHMALSAALVGLPRPVLLSKVAPRAFAAITSPDPVCARHALSAAALAARDNPSAYIQAMEGPLQATLEFHKTSGFLAIDIGIDASASSTMLTKKPKMAHNERLLNLSDPWARVYLARGCGAVVHSPYVRGDVDGVGGPFWEALLIMLSCDPSLVVVMEAIRALAGGHYPRAVQLKSGGATRLGDERREAEEGQAQSIAWQLLVTRSEDEVPSPRPPPPPGSTQAADMLRSFSRKKVLDDPALMRFISQTTSARNLAAPPPPPPLPPPAAASVTTSGGGGADQGAPVVARTLFKRILEQLKAALASGDRAKVCAACRCVQTLAEGRARCFVDFKEDKSVLGGEEMVAGMKTLETAMEVVLRDPVCSAHERSLALEALLWMNLMSPEMGPTGGSLAITPELLVDVMSTGGGTVPLTVRSIFADPWPEDLVQAIMNTLLRRLLVCPQSAPYLLACSSAVAGVCPSRMKQEQLHLMWDTAVKHNDQTRLAALTAAMGLLSAPMPPITQPPSTAAAEVKALAAKEEVAMMSLVRSAAWWLGENANFATAEYVWKPRQGKAIKKLSNMLNPDVQNGKDKKAKEGQDGNTVLPGVDLSYAEKVVHAAMALNPLLAMIISQLQRAMLSGAWDVRVASGQSLAKIAVRSGEPFRVQCYGLMMAAMKGEEQDRGSSGPVNQTGPGGDPLGLSGVLRPAVEVLDEMYAGELVLDRLCEQYGEGEDWPPAAIESLEKRQQQLLQAITAKICFVPRELYSPLGAKAKMVLIKDKEKEKEKDQDEDHDAYSETSESSGVATPRSGDVPHYMEALKGFEYKPPEPEETPSTSGVETSASQDFDTDAHEGEEEEDWDRRSSDNSEVMTRRGVVLYDFNPEGEEEVPVKKGDEVEVDYEIAGWFHVTTKHGQQGLVPSTYVELAEEDEDKQSWSAQDYATGRHDTGTQEAPSFRMRVSTADGGPVDHLGGGLHKLDSIRHRRSNSIEQYSGFRRSISIDPGQRRSGSGYNGGAYRTYEDEGPDEVDEYTLGLMEQQLFEVGEEVERVEAQVEEFDTSVKGGAIFNQPQYMALKEVLSRHMEKLEGIKVAGPARQTKIQELERLYTIFDRLENVRRYVLGSPASTPSSMQVGTFHRRHESWGDEGRHQRNVSNLSGLSGTPLSPTYEGTVVEGEDVTDEAYFQSLQQVRVAYGFQAEAEGELTVTEGDVVLVEAEIDGWYQVYRPNDGARGLVPLSYMEQQ